MEKSTKLDVSTTMIEVKAVLELDCFICGATEIISEDSPEETIKEANARGWRNLNSDYYKCIGWWCGCEYELN